MTVALQTIDLEKRFGGIVAANSVSLSLEEGARHALIGPNGAGKTTLINLLTGVLRPSGGRILLGGQNITDMPRHRRVHRGLVRTFQINQLFAGLTPLESAYLAISERAGHGGRWWRRAGADGALVDEAAALLARFGLADDMASETQILSYGKQRLLEVALAVAVKPRVLLLDEPAAGIPAGEREDILAAVADLPRDVSVLLIEHDMDLVFSFADRISVLVGGALLAEGSPDDIAANSDVRAAYLGDSGDD